MVVLFSLEYVYVQFGQHAGCFFPRFMDVFPASQQNCHTTMAFHFRFAEDTHLGVRFGEYVLQIGKLHSILVALHQHGPRS